MSADSTRPHETTLIKGNVNGRFYNSLKIVFILPKYSTMGSGTFQIEMTDSIREDGKTSLSYVGVTAA